MKILFTGGHLTPAVAMIEYIQQHHPDVEMVFVGRQIASLSTGQKSIEADEVGKLGVRFLPLETGKFHQKNILILLQQSWQFFLGLLASLRIIRKEQPDVILSFGGYVAVPIVLAGWLHSVPSVTHEQTRVSGFANQFLSHFVNKVAISFAESKQFFPAKKVVFTGNPLRAKLRDGHKPAWLPEKVSRPILYVTGGSQGAQQLNRIVEALREKLTDEWFVVHQTGQPADAEPKTDVKNYVAVSWISEEEVGWLYAHASLVLARSGANTTMELQAFAVPSLFVPLALTHHHEQEKNAQELVELGMARMVLPDQASPEHIFTELSEMSAQLPKYKTAASAAQKLIPQQVEENVFAVLREVAPQAKR